MPCCCVNTLNLCNAPICDVLEFDVVATESGSGGTNIYTLKLDFLETQIILKQLQTEGEKVIFNISDLNENFEYTAQLFDSNGSLVSIISGEEIYDCIKFKTIQSIGLTGSQSEESSGQVVVIEDVIGQPYSITGSLAAVIGLDDGSTEITCFEFANVRVNVIRGNVPIPGIDPGDSSNFFTKDLASNNILLSSPLIAGEFIRIETIL